MMSGQVLACGDYDEEVAMKTAMAVLGMAVGFTMAGHPLVAFADGMSDPYKAREECEKRGEAKSKQSLATCCSNLILVAKAKEQAKLEAQCIKGRAGKSAAPAPKKESK
jgi:hypothetical protein